MLFSYFSVVKSPDANPVKVDFPREVKPKPGNNLIIDLTGDNQVYIDSQKLPASNLDSIILIEIDKKRKISTDSVVVVINADSATAYGMVFHIVKIARMNGAKTLANVK